jgi:hypothetical protein
LLDESVRAGFGVGFMGLLCSTGGIGLIIEHGGFL